MEQEQQQRVTERDENEEAGSSANSPKYTKKSTFLTIDYVGGPQPKEERTLWKKKGRKRRSRILDKDLSYSLPADQLHAPRVISFTLDEIGDEDANTEVEKSASNSMISKFRKIKSNEEVQGNQDMKDELSSQVNFQMIESLEFPTAAQHEAHDETVQQQNLDVFLNNEQAIKKTAAAENRYNDQNRPESKITTLQVDDAASPQLSQKHTIQEQQDDERLMLRLHENGTVSNSKATASFNDREESEHNPPTVGQVDVTTDAVRDGEQSRGEVRENPILQPTDSNNTSSQRTQDAPKDQRIESARKVWQKIGSMDFGKKVATAVGSDQRPAELSPANTTSGGRLASDTFSRALTQELPAADSCGIGRTAPIAVTISDIRGDGSSKSKEDTPGHQVLLVRNETSGRTEREVEEPMSGTVVLKERTDAVPIKDYDLETPDANEEHKNGALESIDFDKAKMVMTAPNLKEMIVDTDLRRATDESALGKSDERKKTSEKRQPMSSTLVGRAYLSHKNSSKNQDVFTPAAPSMCKRQETHQTMSLHSKNSLRRDSMGMNKVEIGLYHAAVERKISGVLTLEIRDIKIKEEVEAAEKLVNQQRYGGHSSLASSPLMRDSSPEMTNRVSPELMLLEQDYESGSVSDGFIKDAIQKVNPTDLTGYLPKSHLFEDLMKQREEFEKIDSGNGMDLNRDPDDDKEKSLWGIIYSAIHRASKLKEGEKSKLVEDIEKAKQHSYDDKYIMQRQKFMHYLEQMAKGEVEDDKVSEGRASNKDKGSASPKESSQMKKRTGDDFTMAVKFCPGAHRRTNSVGRPQLKDQSGGIQPIPTDPKQVKRMLAKQQAELDCQMMQDLVDEHFRDKEIHRQLRIQMKYKSREDKLKSRIERADDERYMSKFQKMVNMEMNQNQGVNRRMFNSIELESILQEKHLLQMCKDVSTKLDTRWKEGDRVTEKRKELFAGRPQSYFISKNIQAVIRESRVRHGSSATAKVQVSHLDNSGVIQDESMQTQMREERKDNSPLLNFSRTWGDREVLAQRLRSMQNSPQQIPEHPEFAPENYYTSERSGITYQKRDSVGQNTTERHYTRPLHPSNSPKGRNHDDFRFKLNSTQQSDPNNDLSELRQNDAVHSPGHTRTGSLPSDMVDPMLPKSILCHIILRLSFYQRLVHSSLQEFKQKLAQMRLNSAADDALAANSRLSFNNLGMDGDTMDREVADRLITSIDHVRKRKDIKILKQKLGNIFAQYKFLQFLIVQLNFAKIDLENQEIGYKPTPKNTLKLKHTLAKAAGCPHVNNIFKGLKPLNQIDADKDLSLYMIQDLFGVSYEAQRQKQREKASIKYRSGSVGIDERPQRNRKRTRSPPLQQTTLLNGEIVNGVFIPGGRFVELIGFLSVAMRMIVKFYSDKVQKDFSFQQVSLKKMYVLWHQLKEAEHLANLRLQPQILEQRNNTLHDLPESQLKQAKVEARERSDSPPANMEIAVPPSTTQINRVQDNLIEMTLKDDFQIEKQEDVQEDKSLNQDLSPEVSSRLLGQYSTEMPSIRVKKLKKRIRKNNLQICTEKDGTLSGADASSTHFTRELDGTAEPHSGIQTSKMVESPLTRPLWQRRGQLKSAYDRTGGKPPLAFIKEQLPKDTESSVTRLKRKTMQTSNTVSGKNHEIYSKTPAQLREQSAIDLGDFHGSSEQAQSRTFMIVDGFLKPSVTPTAATQASQNMQASLQTVNFVAGQKQIRNSKNMKLNASKAMDHRKLVHPQSANVNRRSSKSSRPPRMFLPNHLRVSHDRVAKHRMAAQHGPKTQIEMYRTELPSGMRTMPNSQLRENISRQFERHPQFRMPMQHDDMNVTSVSTSTAAMSQYMVSPKIKNNNLLLMRAKRSGQRVTEQPR